MTEAPPFPEAEPAPAEPPAPAEAPRPVEGRGPLLVLAYLWLFCLIPLVIEKRDPEVRWHARHGFVLCIAELVASFAWGFVFVLVGSVEPGTIPHLLLVTPWAAFVLIWAHVVLAWEAIHGRRLRVPGVSHWADGPGEARA